MPQPTRPCQQCGNPMDIHPRERNRKKYCSQPCQWRASRRRNPPPPRVKDPGEYVVNTGTCIECGTQTRSKPGAGRAPQTCSDECARQRRSRLAKQRYREQVTTGETIRGHHHEKTCEMCGEDFTARASARFCSHTCRDLANLASGQLLSAARRAQATNTIDPLESSTIRGSCPVQYGDCSECGTKWVGDGRRPQRYCSPECRTRASNTARRLLRRATSCQVAYIDCPECGTTFTASPMWGKVYCSKTCRTRRERRANPRPKREAPWLAHREVVFARDGNTCWLCGDLTSEVYRHDDPWSPTLDHVIPRAHGGSDDVENLRTAHALCNSLKGDRSVETTADLVAARRASA